MYVLILCILLQVTSELIEALALFESASVRDTHPADPEKASFRNDSEAQYYPHQLLGSFAAEELQEVKREQKKFEKREQMN
jgi:hypothetical protein